MALGGILGGGGGGDSVTVRTHIPGFLRPLVRQQADIGQGALSGLSGMLGGATAEDLVAGFTPDQLAGFDFARQQFQPGGAFTSALDALTGTARGDFLMGGEGFDQAVQSAIRTATPQIASAFGGRNSGLATANLGEVATNAFADQFAAERANQLRAAGMLPGVITSGTGLLGNIGAQQQQQAQRELTAPITAQETLLGLSGAPINLSALLGQTTTQNTQSSPIAGAITGGLGGALTGGQLGAMSGTPFGAFAGALGGGALGGIGGLLG